MEKNLHPYDPRKPTKFDARQKLCLSVFFNQEGTAHHEYAQNQYFYLQVLRCSMMQFAISDQENGSLVHGKFIMTMHQHTQPKLSSIS
jgi:hypothetical protein